MPIVASEGDDLGLVHEVLKVLIRKRGFTLRSVSRALGWHEDYASQLFRGVPRLRVDQLLEILGVLGVRPGDFFAELSLAFDETAGGPASAPRRLRSDAATRPAGLDDVLALIDARIEAALGATVERRESSGEGA